MCQSFAECQHCPEGPGRGVQPLPVQYGNHSTTGCLVGSSPETCRFFSSTLEDHTMGCQKSPCLVATGLVVADTTTLTSVQRWLSLAPWSSGYVDTERWVLLQMLVPASHEALAESCTHSALVSHSGLLWFCIRIVSTLGLCRVMPWHHLPFPHL